MASKSPFVSLILSTLIVLFGVFVAAAPATGAAALSGSSYWLSQIQRQGAVAYGNDTNYKIFRNVMDYGAKGR